jgi:hypothetical protein
VRWDRRIHDQVVFVNGGPLLFHWERSEPVPLSGLYPADSWIERAGFRVKHSHTYYGATAITNEMFSLAFPLWVVVAAGAAMPVTVMMRRRAVRRRARFGLCPRCGYDLRATPERCPECGVVPSL